MGLASGIPVVSVCVCSLRPAGRDACGFQLPLPVGCGGWAPQARSVLAGGFLGSQAGFGKWGDGLFVRPLRDQDLRKESLQVSGGVQGRPPHSTVSLARHCVPSGGLPFHRPDPTWEGGQARVEPSAPASRRGVSRPPPPFRGRLSTTPRPCPESTVFSRPLVELLPSGNTFLFFLTKYFLKKPPSSSSET